MEFKPYRLGDLGRMIVGGDKPSICSNERTNECPVPIYSNGISAEGLYGFTNKARIMEPCITISARGTVGAVFFRKEPFLPIVRLIAFIPDKNKVDVKYLYYYLTLSHLDGFGTSQQQITAPYLSRIKVSITEDLPTQRRIASILSAYDNLIENNTRRILLLEQMAENLYKEWFVRFRFPGHEKVEFENGLPKGWRVERVKGIVKRLPFNKVYKGYELEKEGKVIVIDQSTDEYLGFHNNEPSHYADYDAPLIIFGDHSCKFQLMTRNFSLGENVIPYTTNNKKEVNAYWLFYATHKLIQTEEYKRHWGRLSAMKILVPEFQLQLQFAETIKLFEKEKSLLSTKNSLLIRQRDLLLPRLMSGKLEVKQ